MNEGFATIAVCQFATIIVKKIHLFRAFGRWEVTYKHNKHTQLLAILVDIYLPFLDFPYLDFWKDLNLKRPGLEQFVMVVSKTKQGYRRFLLLSVLFRHHSS